VPISKKTSAVLRYLWRASCWSWSRDYLSSVETKARKHIACPAFDLDRLFSYPLVPFWICPECRERTITMGKLSTFWWCWWSAAWGIHWWDLGQRGSWCSGLGMVGRLEALAMHQKHKGPCLRGLERGRSRHWAQWAGKGTRLESSRWLPHFIWVSFPPRFRTVYVPISPNPALTKLHESMGVYLDPSLRHHHGMSSVGLKFTDMICSMSSSSTTSSSPVSPTKRLLGCSKRLDPL